MTQDVFSKLDNLLDKSQKLVKALDYSRNEQRRLQKKIDLLQKQNDLLKQKLEAASGQIGEMLHQWFPETTDPTPAQE